MGRSLSPQSYLLGLLVAGVLLGAHTASAEEALKVVAVSDINGRYGTVSYAPRVSAAVERAIDLDVDVFVIAGDMIAGQRPSPRLGRRELEAMWAHFHATVTEPLDARGIPVLVTPGNHDASRQAPFSLERAVYAETWAHREPSAYLLDGGSWPFHYAVGFGAALFVSLDATEPGRLPEEQLVWLRSVLEREHGRFETVVVFGHLPLWPIAVGREREILRDPGLRDLLAEWQVDAYLSGHHHAFYDGTYAGVRYIAQAALGGGRRVLVGANARSAHALTLLTLAPGTLRVEALLAPDYQHALDPLTLPGAIESPLGLLRRSAGMR